MDAFNCPITYEEMKDPVLAMDGHTYERASIERWINESPNISIISPMTGEMMGRLLIPNYALKKAIDEYNTREVRENNELSKIEKEILEKLNVEKLTAKLFKALLKLIINYNNNNMINNKIINKIEKSQNLNNNDNYINKDYLDNDEDNDEDYIKNYLINTNNNYLHILST